MYEDPNFEMFMFPIRYKSGSNSPPQNSIGISVLCSKIRFYKRKFQVLFLTKFIFPHQF